MSVNKFEKVEVQSNWVNLGKIFGANPTNFNKFQLCSEKVFPQLFGVKIYAQILYKICPTDCANPC